MDDADIDELRSALARIVRRLRAEKADNQLGETQSSALMLLSREGPRTLGQLSEHARVTPPSMNEAVNSLSAAGYVVRDKDPGDLRKVLIVATPAGLAWAGETSRRRHEWLGRQIDRVPPAEQKILVRAARILRDMAAS